MIELLKQLGAAETSNKIFGPILRGSSLTQTTNPADTYIFRTGNKANEINDTPPGNDPTFPRPERELMVFLLGVDGSVQWVPITNNMSTAEADRYGETITCQVVKSLGNRPEYVLFSESVPATKNVWILR